MRKAFLIAGLMAALALAALGLSLGYSASEAQKFFVYLPLVEHSGAVHISIRPCSYGSYVCLIPDEVAVRPGTTVAWTNKTAVLSFSGFWNGSPSVSRSWFAPNEMLTIQFNSPGTFNYNVIVNPGSLLQRGVSGSVTVAEEVPPYILDLWVSKRASSSEVRPGDELSYYIFLDNVGVVGIPVTLTDTIPAAVSFQSVSVGAVYSPTINSILWSGTVEPAVGSPSKVLGFTVKVGSDYKPFTNTVWVSSGWATVTDTVQVAFPTPTPTFTPTPTPTPTPPVPTPTPIVLP